ncbi:hypothetical protein NSERUTF1_5927 [Nocardia seriolae]|nr:hypothetical protein NSERUTF1_5927 [Nocardia seriolae]
MNTPGPVEHARQRHGQSESAPDDQRSAPAAREHGPEQHPEQPHNHPAQPAPA